ncbi:hypothetical protein [Rhodopirellula sallentina]|uniref:TPR repeat-containing protein n=1 Tax=Rhodopirellula sallentina SM41 TaxID=1263870 RepID=M5UA66_9BACT|nr:hypothetical protein [Rhodopirellula sallentina]EMI58310.1 hypothetical protein RSSM_00243 [Rhodopirellula sallentina SM41]
MTRTVNTIVFEEHSEVLPYWFEKGVKNAVVVCFDAHLDVQRITASRLKRLVASKTSDELRAEMKPHHLMPDWDAVASRSYSFGIEDFFFAAARMGVVRKLIWVAPSHVPIHDMQSAIEQLQQTDGVTIEDLRSFSWCSRNSDAVRWIEGELLGIELTVCHREALPHVGLPSSCLVDIDLDYFVELPSEQIGVSPVQVVADLMELPLEFSEVTISRSVESGFTPLRYSTLDQELQRAFDEAVGKLTSGGEKQATTTHGVKTPLNDGLRRACEYPARGLPVAPVDVQALQREFESTKGSIQDRGLFYAAIGILWCHLGDLDSARDCYGVVAEAFGVHPELALEIARLLIESECWFDAGNYLQDALNDDKTCAAACNYLGLIAAESARQNGDETQLRVAADWFAKAHERTPAWQSVVENLVHVHRLLGEMETADRFYASLRDVIEIKSRLCGQTSE